MTRFLYDDNFVGPWVAKRSGGEWTGGGDRTIGYLSRGRLIAGVILSGWNGANIFLDVAAEPGSLWATPEFLSRVFSYTFLELSCKRVSGVVAADNLPARKFNEHLGFTLEAVLRDAHPNGDLLVYAMMREDCRWLSPSPRHHGTQI